MLAAQGTLLAPPGTARAPAQAAARAAQAPDAARPEAPKQKAAPPPVAAPLDGGWPREVKTSAGVVTAYQPQIDAWDGSRLALCGGRLPAGEGGRGADLRCRLGGGPHGGGQGGSARDLQRPRVQEGGLPVPSREERPPPRGRAQGGRCRSIRTMALDRFAALRGGGGGRQGGPCSLQLDDTPPRIVVSTTPALLAYVDGEPAWRPVKDTKLERAINTRVLLLRQGDDRD